MAIVKIRMNTWTNGSKRAVKFKRGLAPRDGFIDFDKGSNKYYLKEGDKKWKPYDTTISRKLDSAYIENKKKFNEGLCFSSKKEAKQWLIDHKDLADKFASENPLFANWSIMSVCKRFAPASTIVYGKDIKK